MVAIEFENVSKQYKLGLVSTRTLSHDLNRWWVTTVLRKEDPYLKIGETNDRSSKGNSDYVWALKNIDFKVNQGDVVGIIGKNGAGKSTLLKLLSRVTNPTTGIIRARGRIASLLEVGTGFHPEMTGRENIFMNGSIMGMTKPEIKSKIDEIIDFAGVERYIDTPVKRYSSGMIVRLGFAVAAHLDPEILVVDEVLAVGDAEFQKKAIGKMQDISSGTGRTVLFVSHNMGAVKNLCKTGVVLENGIVAYSGTANDAVDYYLSSGHNEIREKVWSENDAITQEGIKLLSAKIISKKQRIESGDGFDIEFIFKNDNDNQAQYDVTFFLYDELNNPVFLSSTYSKEHIIEKTADGIYKAICHISENLLGVGSYRIGRVLFLKNDSVLFETKDLLYFEIEKKQTGLYGYQSGKETIIEPVFDWSYTYNDKKLIK